MDGFLSCKHLDRFLDSGYPEFLMLVLNVLKFKKNSKDFNFRAFFFLSFFDVKLLKEV